MDIKAVYQDRVTRLSLDVASPDDVAGRLRRNADAYRESAQELASTWQDAQAGKVWDRMADLLDKAATVAEMYAAQVGK